MPIPDTTLLSNFPVVRTRDLKFARDRLSDVYGADRLDLPEAGPIAVTLNHLPMATLSLSYLRLDGCCSLGFREDDVVRQLFNIEGVGRLTGTARCDTISRGGWTPAIPPCATIRLDVEANYRHLDLRIELAALRRCLSALLGEEVDGELEFPAQDIDNNPALHSLKLRVFQFASDYNARGLYFSTVASVEIERMLAMNFLFCHRHSYSMKLLREPVPVSSSAVRLAEEYIVAHWDQPLDIVELARVAKVGARSLFRQFKRERGYSPTSFAKNIRLRRALVALENPDEGTTVTEVALKCGFQNMGHFARDYRSAIGELPSETLTRARSR